MKQIISHSWTISDLSDAVSNKHSPRHLRNSNAELDDCNRILSTKL